MILPLLVLLSFVAAFEIRNDDGCLVIYVKTPHIQDCSLPDEFDIHEGKLRHLRTGKYLAFYKSTFMHIDEYGRSTIGSGEASRPRTLAAHVKLLRHSFWFMYPRKYTLFATVRYHEGCLHASNDEITIGSCEASPTLLKAI